jgi:hypothetical protein
VNHATAKGIAVARLPEGPAASPLLEVVEADVLSLTTDDFRRRLDGCGVVISCLGHTNTVRGIFGPPFDLVTRVVEKVCRTAEAIRPTAPVRLILMTSVSVNRPGGADTVRGSGERMAVSALRGLVPVARDNQDAADFLCEEVPEGGGCVEWVVVRPDSLMDGDITEYRVGDELFTTLAKPGKTNMANIAHFMCELATDDETWRRWKSRMPVIENVAPGASG